MKLRLLLSIFWWCWIAAALLELLMLFATRFGWFTHLDFTVLFQMLVF